MDIYSITFNNNSYPDSLTAYEEYRTILKKFKNNYKLFEINYFNDLNNYGNNYINEYVCFNHIIASCYLDKNKDKYLIITRDDYNSFVNMLLLRSEQKSLLLSELKNKFITPLKN